MSRIDEEEKGRRSNELLKGSNGNEAELMKIKVENYGERDEKLRGRKLKRRPK